MSKIKLKDLSCGLCFNLFILFRKKQTKLKLVLTKKLFIQAYRHFGPVVNKVKTERVVPHDANLCVRVWGSKD